MIATLRVAKLNDLDAVRALLRGASLPTDGVAEAFDDFVVAERDGQIVGAGGLEIAGDAALLRSIVVGPAWRGHALGQRITSRLIANARDRGLTGIWLLTTTAQDFFPRFGFRPVGREAVPDGLARTAELTGACPASATLLARRAQPLRVLFLCTANSARSQLGEALLAHTAGDLASASSAGSRPGGGPHALAIAVLGERGIAWQGKSSKEVDAAAGAPWDLVITVCDAARDECPLLPGFATAHWGLPDPALGGIEDFRVVADELQRRIDQLLEMPLVTMTPDALARAASALAAP